MNSKWKKYWHNKVVLVTGASSGLGRDVVKALAPYQVHFGLISRREEKLQELAKELADSGSTFWTCSCDIRDREQVTKAIHDFAKEAGKIDAAWVNSGVSHDSSYDGWNWNDIETMLDTNLKGAVYTTKACLDIMKDQPSGTIIGIGSAASMRGLPRRSIYSATKIALDYFLESTAVEFPHLQFTMIHPGYVDTPINRDNKGRFWLMTSDKAAQLMINAVTSGKTWYVYPWKMSLLYRLARNFPNRLYRRFARKNMHLSRSKKEV